MRERFDKLRKAYVTKKAKLDEREDAIRQRYGGNWRRHWLKASEEKDLTKKAESVDVARRAFFDYLTEISPRDWGFGVPYHWLCEELTYEDAVRPLGERLSVVPPLSYGATEHKT